MRALTFTWTESSLDPAPDLISDDDLAVMLAGYYGCKALGNFMTNTSATSRNAVYENDVWVPVFETVTDVRFFVLIDDETPVDTYADVETKLEMFLSDGEEIGFFARNPSAKGIKDFVDAEQALFDLSGDDGRG